MHWVLGKRSNKLTNRNLSHFVVARLLLLSALLACSNEKETTGGNDVDKNTAIAPEDHESDGIDKGGDGSIGKTGSTARFTVLGERLYAISGGGLTVFDISDGKELSKVGFSAVAGDIETLHNDAEKLYIGAETALYIYNVDDPNQPTRTGSLTHARSCDPVVTQGTTAYITLRSNQCRCLGDTNRLKVVDVASPEQPVEISSYELTEPGGLGIVGSRLFVCDGPKGLIELNVGDPKAISETTHVDDEKCSDVIPIDQVLLVSGTAGLSQYDLSVEGLKRLSRIEVGAKPNQ